MKHELKRIIASFHEKIESIQYNACLALTGAMRGTSKEKIYQELGLESLQIRRWYRKLCLFYKIYKNQSPSYLYNIIPTTNTHYTFRNSDKIPYFKTKHNFFKSNILKFIQPSSNSFFHCHNPIGIKYITRIRLGLSHLREHKFKHSFQDTLNPICNCGNDVEFFLHCPLYSNERRTLLNSLVNIDHTLLDNTDFLLTQILMFGNITFNAKENTKNNQLGHWPFLSTRRFDESLLWIVFFFLSSPFNNDSSDIERILSEVSPGLLGH